MIPDWLGLVIFGMMTTAAVWFTFRYGAAVIQYSIRLTFVLSALVILFVMFLIGVGEGYI
jgi:hypothetical protein